MAEEKKTRTRRTKEERIKPLEEKIAYHQKCIDALKAKIDEIKNPPENQYKELLKVAKSKGITVDKLMEFIEKQ